MEILNKSDFVDSEMGMTVQDLLDFIKERNIPMTAKVMIQRVEDKYFDGVDISGMTDSEGNVYPSGTRSTGWGVFLKKGYAYYEAEQININLNAEIDRRVLGKEPNYPKIEDPAKLLVDLSDIGLLEQYHPAYCPVFYDDDEDLLFIDLHY
jgi:hypothetical protein